MRPYTFENGLEIDLDSIIAIDPVNKNFCNVGVSNYATFFNILVNGKVIVITLNEISEDNFSKLNIVRDDLIKAWKRELIHFNVNN